MFRFMLYISFYESLLLFLSFQKCKCLSQSIIECVTVDGRKQIWSQLLNFNI